MGTVSWLIDQMPVGRLGEPARYFATVGSTNDVAKGMAEEGAPHGALVVADEQTAGRGRSGTRWLTPPGTALAMSLVVRPDDLSAGGLLALNVLGALSVAESIETLGGEPQIKWPNDVLLAGRKVAGVLVEAAWQETRLEYAVIGTGVNVLPGSVPPDREVAFPATSVAGVLGSPVDRGELLLRILGSLDRWLDALGSPALLEAWQRRLAYLGGQIVIEGPVGEERGVLAGISAAGGLVLEGTDGQRRSLGAGYHSLRPVDSGWE